MENPHKATLEEMDAKAHNGLYRAAEAIGDDPQLMEVLRYLEQTWEYLYSNTLVVGVQLHAMNLRTDEEIVQKLKEMRSTIKGAVIKEHG